jgi:AAA domain
MPQFKIAAVRILTAFEQGTLHSIAVADPEAGRVDDFQMLTSDAASLRVDAFQVKWSHTNQPIADVELRGLIAEAIAGRRLLELAWARRQTPDELPVRRFIVHIHTNRPISTAGLRGEAVKGRSLTLPRFFSEVWRPAQRGAMRSLEDVPERWRGYVAVLAGEAGIEVPVLLKAAADVRIEPGSPLPEDLPLEDWSAGQFLRDVRAFVVGLLEAVTDDRDLVVLDAAAFLDVVGDEYAARWRPRSRHSFPVPPDFQPMRETEQALERALSEFSQGYLFVTGSPGSGKSTLLTRVLTGDPRLVARYYAFVPDDDTATRGEAHALLHDLLLALDNRERLRCLAPPRDQLPILRRRLLKRLQELGIRASASGTVAIILIDGLDHVSRDPRPETPFLGALFPIEAIPDGVLFILGTRNTADLPAHLQAEAQLPGRRIGMAPMDRRGTRDLAAHAGLEPLVQERVWVLSGGHPLLARTFTKLATSADPDDVLNALAEIPSLDGEVTRYYEKIWVDLQADADLVALLGLICRLRTPIDLTWLEVSGTQSATLERLGRLEHLFQSGAGPRWSFFHDSFREFLAGRTAQRLGVHDPAKQQRLHAELARRCSETSPNRPEAWEELHHRLRAGDAVGLLRRATTEFFRAQLEALRPPDDVLPGICEASAALSDEHDVLALVQLVLSAAECSVRGYSQPANGAFLELLIDLGYRDAALAHLRHSTDGNDQTVTALELVLTLHDRGLIADAAHVFAEHEPLELLANRRPAGRGQFRLTNPWKTLYAWGAAAALVHGPQYVIAQAERIELTAADFQHGEDVAEVTAIVKANILKAAAESIAIRTGRDASEPILAALPPSGHGSGVRFAVLVRLAHHTWSSGDSATTSTLIHEALTHHDANLQGDTAAVAAELLVRLGEIERARQIAQTLPAIAIPTDRPSSDEDVGWRSLLRRLRLQAALDGPLDPVTAIPDGDNDWKQSRVVVARHLVRLANLWGRELSGERPSPNQICEVVGGVLALWDYGSTVERQRFFSAVAGRRTIEEGAVVLAGLAGPDVLKALWRWWQDRRSEQGHPQDGGTRLIRAFHEAGLGNLSIRARLDSYATLLADDPNTEAGDWTELAVLRLAANDEPGAREGLRRCVASTFAVGYKDYQLSTWIQLLRPLLHGRGGQALSAWLAARIEELEESSDSGAAHDAARTLARVVGEARPADVLNLARSLRDGNVFDVNDVVETVLEATAARADRTWWTVLGEILVPLGGAPIALDAACTTTVSSATLTAELRGIADRVAIEGRPTQRRNWRHALIDAAASRGIPSGALGIVPADLELGDETPDRETIETHTDTKDPGGLPPESADELLARLEAGDRGYEGLRPAIDRLGELDEPQRERLLALAEDDNGFTKLTSKLADEAMDAGRFDDAWTWAEQALTHARGLDWSRRYAGGPALDAALILQRLDGNRARPCIFESFAAAVAVDTFLLGGFANDLNRDINVFGPLDEKAVAAIVLNYVVALSGVPAPSVAAAGPSNDGAPIGGGSPPIGVAANECARLTAWLLAMTHTVAWSSAQRAALLLLQEGGAAAAAMQKALFDDVGSIPPERVIALFAGAFADAQVVPDADLVVSAMTEHATGARLDLRLAAATLLRRLGAPVPAAPSRTLPGGLRLVVSRAPKVFSGAAAIGEGALDEMIGYYGPMIRQLASLADVDPDALAERIRRRAHQLAGSLPSDREIAAQRTVLGSGYARPSATAVGAAQQEAAAELVDAGRVSLTDALAATWTLPHGDIDLLARRPERRPACVPAAAPLSDRTFSAPDWFDGIVGAQDRLAIEWDGWVVIAEWSELTLLDRHHPREGREQALVPGDAQSLYTSVRLSLGDARHAGSLRSDESLIMRNTQSRPGLDDGFIGLHPAAASAADLEPDEHDPLGWCLGGQSVVRSVWWRSGFASWPPYSERDEVGGGWLILARPIAVEALLCAFPAARVRWVVSRRVRDDNGERPSVVEDGERPLSV